MNFEYLKCDLFKNFPALVGRLPESHVFNMEIFIFDSNLMQDFQDILKEIENL